MQTGDPFERGEAVHGDPGRPKLLHCPSHSQQMVFQPVRVWIIRHYQQITVALELLEIDVPARRVAVELVAALLESEEQAALPALRAAVDELRDRERFPRARRAGHQNDRVAEETAAAHLIEFVVPRRDADVRRLLLELDRRERDDDKAITRIDGERELPLVVVSAPEFQDFDRAAPPLFNGGVPQNDDVVYYELFHAEARELAVLVAPLRCQERCDTKLLQRGDQPEHLNTQRSEV